MSMSLKQYILFLASGTAITFCAWLIVLISINPATTGAFGFLAFYLTLFVTLIGFLATLATLIRIIRKKHTTIESMMRISLRQGILFAILLETSLILLSKGYFSTMVLLLLILTISIIEFISLSADLGTNKSS
ncbi:hypothetical protein KJ673_02465 [Patescibacteria group bacterium]|nr:hypothetical protein [Patescibacteria group bacterium]MBU4452639.1 hypothetical protein [Patescibacteria group bacterium]MCG2687684.1 hypothetical protein [Candidatus Parcubacteria bacterium]